MKEDDELTAQQNEPASSGTSGALAPYSGAMTVATPPAEEHAAEAKRLRVADA